MKFTAILSLPFSFLVPFLLLCLSKNWIGTHSSSVVLCFLLLLYYSIYIVCLGSQKGGKKSLPPQQKPQFILIAWKFPIFDSFLFFGKRDCLLMLHLFWILISRHTENRISWFLVRILLLLLLLLLSVYLLVLCCYRFSFFFFFSFFFHVWQRKHSVFFLHLCYAVSRSVSPKYFFLLKKQKR